MKKWLFIGAPVIAAIVFLFLPGAYRENFLLFGLFLILPVYASWLPGILKTKFEEKVNLAYLYPAAALLLYELIYTVALKTFEATAAGVVTMLLPWIAFAAGIFVWKLLGSEKHLMSLIPSFVLFFVSAFPAQFKPMLVTICTVFIYISISVITAIFNKLGKKNHERVQSVKRTVLIVSVLMLVSVIMSVSNL